MLVLTPPHPLRASVRPCVVAAAVNVRVWRQVAARLAEAAIAEDGAETLQELEKTKDGLGKIAVGRHGVSCE